MLDSAGHRYNDYDALGRPGRVERSIDAVNYVFTNAYNAAGMPTSTTYPDAQTISWTYDVSGNLQTETGTITTGTYDAFGRPTSLSFANGVVTTTAYSPTRGWVENITSATGGITHQDLDYSHYADGMISGITSVKSMETWTYVYDDLNRLLSATNLDTPSLTQTFTYDDVGNLTYNSAIGSYTYNTPGTGQPHAVQTAGARSYVYDAAGRMTSRDGQVISWNGDGKPSSIGSTQFTYGGTGERLKKVTGSSVTRYVGGDYEIAPDGTVTKTLVGGKQMGTDIFVHHRDHLGSIQAVSDVTGVEVRRQDHAPFGDQHYAWGSHAESKGWIGEREEETELVYLNARYYDPEIARFVSTDPIVRVGQRLNRYTYAANNPINFRDPSGLDECQTVTNTGAYQPDGVNIPTHAPTTTTTCKEGSADLGGTIAGANMFNIAFAYQSLYGEFNRMEEEFSQRFLAEFLRDVEGSPDSQDSVEAELGTDDGGPGGDVNVDKIVNPEDHPGLDLNSDRAVSANTFANHAKGKDWSALANEQPTQPRVFPGGHLLPDDMFRGGPDESVRYVRDPLYPSRVIDMRHFLVSR